MRVKRYIVDSMPDALQKIRSDLGKDAVILNTKEIRSGGFLGFFGKKKIEVVAAIDTNSSSNSNKVGFGVKGESKPTATSAKSPPVPTKLAPIAVMDEPLPFVPDVIFPNETRVPPKVVSEKEDTLLAEIRQMKEMMQKLSQRKTGIVEEQNPILSQLEQRLLDQEVHSELVRQMIDTVMDETASSGDPLTKQQAYQAVRSQLHHLLKPSSIKTVAATTKVVHFVGPTGVGKTTTIAKLAAEQVLKHHRKVGFITSDTYRIAAVEQLKTYATILNIPLEVVFSPLDLKKAFSVLEDRDIIFMDTAGRNFRNEMYVSELNALLQNRGHSETFLVLSLTTKYKDMKAITNNFSKFKLDKVLFTKMDETDTFGSIVNLVNDFSLQLSYLANGQNVPDDIFEADEAHIIDLILGEATDE